MRSVCRQVLGCLYWFYSVHVTKCCAFVAFQFLLVQQTPYNFYTESLAVARFDRGFNCNAVNSEFAFLSTVLRNTRLLLHVIVSVRFLLHQIHMTYLPHCFKGSKKWNNCSINYQVNVHKHTLSFCT